MKKRIITYIFILMLVGGVIQLFQPGITPFIIGYSIFAIILSSSILVGASLVSTKKTVESSNHISRKGSW